jgi:hypothetical protein
LADFLKDFTKATAVYIGNLVAPKRPIRDEDDEFAHRDEESAKIIHFGYATKGHEYLINRILRQDQGLTFDVFREDEPVEQEQLLNEGDDGYEEQQERLR